MNLIIKKIKEGSITIQELTDLVSNVNNLIQIYENDYVLGYIYKYIFYSDNFNKKDTHPILKTIKRYAKTNKLIAEIAFANGNFTTAILNEKFLLANHISYVANDLHIKFDLMKYLFDETNGIEQIIPKLKEKNILNALCSIPKTGELLCWKSPELGNITIIEYLCKNFKNKFTLVGITPTDLLHVTDNGITLFEFLITNYPETIIDLLNNLPKDSIEYKVISEMVNTFGNPQITKIIKINDEHKETLITKYEKEYFNKRLNKEQAMKEISIEAIAAIEEFKTIMNTGEKSDPELIELGCLAFIEQFVNNNSHAMNDLYSLINIKKQNPEFCIKKDKQSRFNSKEKAIYLSSIYNIDTFNHESTHAIHYYANDFAKPNEFEFPYDFSANQLEKIYYIAKEINTKVSDLSQTFHKENYQEELISPPEEYYLDYLNQIKLDLTEAVNDQSYPKEIIDFIIKKGISSKSEFILQYELNEILEIVMARTNMELNLYTALEDIFDALSLGIFSTSGITINDNKKEQFVSGHGEEYYNEHSFNSEKAAFSEIIAQYVTIIKSPNAKELINTLADIMGQEFVDMLQNFYENMYVDDKSYTKGA